jgi:uncharacterized protein (TIGR00251 family)
MPPAWFCWDGHDLMLQLRVQPRASRDEFAGIIGACLKVRLTAPPLEGRANDHLIAFLAKAFGVPQRQVQLEQGAAGRHKRLRIQSPKTLPPALEIGLRP